MSIAYLHILISSCLNTLGISNNFNPGYPTPYRVLLEDMNVGGDLYSESGFQRITESIQLIKNSLPYTELIDFYGVNAIDGQFVSYTDMSSAVEKLAVTKNISSLTSTEQTYVVSSRAFVFRALDSRF